MKQQFKEKQKFTQWWLWVLLIGVTLIPVYGIYQQIFLGEPYGNNPMPDFGLIIFLLFMLAFLGFIWVIQLTTIINETSIDINFFPFTRKTIKWDDVQKAEVINYGFQGGWGIRVGTRHGTVYNIRGNKGLALTLKNGDKLCIGTQKESELKEIVKNISK